MKIVLLLVVLLASPTATFAQTGQGQDPPPAPAVPTTTSPGPTIEENDDDDNDARRLRVNATAKLELPSGTIQVIYPLLPADGPDAAAIASLADGDVLQLTRSMPVKLKTEVELRFGGGVVAGPENVASGYPGVYSLWLRRKGDGWAMVVNGEPDIWGTMRDPAADVGERPMTYRRDHTAPAPVFAVTLLQSDGGGQLEMRWGVHRWTADFEAGKGMPTWNAK